MKLKDIELTDPNALKSRLGNELSGNRVSYNTLLTALCYLMAELMLMAEESDPRNTSKGVAKRIGETIQETYDEFRNKHNERKRNLN